MNRFSDFINYLLIGGLLFGLVQVFSQTMQKSFPLATWQTESLSLLILGMLLFITADKKENKNK